jgi:putative SOS response-associated peptidase YedK
MSLYLIKLIVHCGAGRRSGIPGRARHPQIGGAGNPYIRMCGRYSLLCIDDLGRRFRVTNPAIGFRSHFNIAPSTEQPVVVHGDANALVLMRWGLIPSWAKDPAIGHRLINARAETLFEKPAFRSLVKNRRCLVPASGFFEWEHGGKRKTPYYITVRGQALFAFAGLHDTWKSPDGSILRTYTIITTRPNDMVARVHDRMPAILLPQHEDIWAGQTLRRCSLPVLPMRWRCTVFLIASIRRSTTRRMLSDP